MSGAALPPDSRDMHNLDAWPDSAAWDGSDSGGTSGGDADQAALLTYEPFFGLREKPFSLSANPRFLYRGSAHADAFARLDAGIRRREGLIVLTGEIGTGKTLLCRAVLDQLDRRTCSTFVVDPFITREELLKSLLVGFGVTSLTELQEGRMATAARQELSFALRDFLVSLVPAQAFAVLVVDEAQHLSPLVLEEIRILAELETRHKLIQVVLTGSPELRTALKRPDVRHVEQHVSVRCDLSLLDPPAVTGYIAHRLAIAARGGAVPVFTEAAAAIVAVASAGVPRAVNRICDRALHAAWISRTPSITAETVQSALIELEMAMPEGPFAEASCESAVSMPERTSSTAAANRASVAEESEASATMARRAPVPEERERPGNDRRLSSKHRNERTALSGRVWGAPVVDADALTQFSNEAVLEAPRRVGPCSQAPSEPVRGETTRGAFSPVARRCALAATAAILVVLVANGVGALNMDLSLGWMAGSPVRSSLPPLPVAAAESSRLRRLLITPDEHLAVQNDGLSRAPGVYTIRVGVFAHQADAYALASDLSVTPLRTAIRRMEPRPPGQGTFELVVEGNGTLEHAIASANRLRQHPGAAQATVVGLPGAFAARTPAAPRDDD